VDRYAASPGFPTPPPHLDIRLPAAPPPPPANVRRSESLAPPQDQNTPLRPNSFSFVSHAAFKGAGGAQPTVRSLGRSRALFENRNVKFVSGSMDGASRAGSFGGDSFDGDDSAQGWAAGGGGADGAAGGAGGAGGGGGAGVSPGGSGREVAVTRFGEFDSSRTGNSSMDGVPPPWGSAQPLQPLQPLNSVGSMGSNRSAGGSQQRSNRKWSWRK
jgi:hypothetical protein